MLDGDLKTLKVYERQFTVQKLFIGVKRGRSRFVKCLP